MLDKKRKNVSKRIFTVICIMVVFCIFVVGCSEKKDKNGSMKAEDGRSYGGLIEGEIGETVHTAFFDLTVLEASRYNTYQFEDGLYQADSGKTYLVMKITVKNTYEKDLPMSITDFTLDYSGKDAKDVITGYGKADLKQDDFMENIFTLKKGESVTKYILFTVADKKTYTLNYAEYYEDKFEGNKFQINVKPEKKETDSVASPDTSTPTQKQEKKEASESEKQGDTKKE